MLKIHDRATLKPLNPPPPPPRFAMTFHRVLVFPSARYRKWQIQTPYSLCIHLPPPHPHEIHVGCLGCTPPTKIQRCTPSLSLKNSSLQWWSNFCCAPVVLNMEEQEDIGVFWDMRWKFFVIIQKEQCASTVRALVLLRNVLQTTHKAFFMNIISTAGWPARWGFLRCVADITLGLEKCTPA